MPRIICIHKRNKYTLLEMGR